MSNDPVDRPTNRPPPSRPPTRNNPVPGTVLPNGGFFIAPTQSFGAFLERRQETNVSQDKHENHDEDDRGKTPEERAEDGAVVGEQDSSGKTIYEQPGKRIRNVKAMRERQGRGSDGQSGGNSQQQRDDRRQRGQSTESVRSARVGGEKPAGVSQVPLPPQAMGAERALKEMEQISTSRLRNVPPEVLNQVVSQISSHWVADNRQEILIRLRREWLDGDVTIRFTESDDGFTDLTFEGDEEAVSRLAAHEGELAEQLLATGKSVRLRFT